MRPKNGPFISPIILTALAALLAGCATYSRERTTADGTTEIVRARFFGGKAEAKAINAKVVDGDYSYEAGVGEIAGESDTMNQAALLESVARGVATGLSPTP